MARTYWLETLGCPKNEVDSEKLAALMASDGLTEAADPASADLVVVNTCAFVEEAREESVATILDLHERRNDSSELVVTGCMAERYGSELAEHCPRRTGSAVSECRSLLSACQWFSAPAVQPALPNRGRAFRSSICSTSRARNPHGRGRT
ncbi:MAG: hypothetical protein R2789_15290 [Microthrixaceae bacterium]